MDALPPDDELPPDMDELPPDMDELPPDDEGPTLEAGPSPARRRLRIAITLVLVASLVVLAAIEGSGVIVRPRPELPATPSPSSPAAAARIALVDVDGALSSMDATGGSIIRYPAPGVVLQFPAWSPDGTRIATIALDDQGAAIDVFAAATGGSAAAPTIVYQRPGHPAFYLYWAPDGEALAFLTTEPDGIALRHTPADASAPDTIVRNGAPMYWQWVDPGRLFVHSGGAAIDAFVGEVGIDGAPATGAIPAGMFRAPALSGNGSYLAFAGPGEGTLALVVAESRDRKTHFEVPVFGTAAFEFSPVGDTLAFVGAAAAGGPTGIPLGPLRAMDPATGAVQTLLGGSVVTFFWSPDGQTIAALRLPGPNDNNVTLRNDEGVSLVRAEIGGAGAPGALAAEPTAALAAPRVWAVTRTGAVAAAPETAAGSLLRLAFVDVASGAIRSERTVRLSDLFILQVLPYFDQYALSHRFWSPDSASIVLPLDDDQGISQITIIPADGTAPRTLAPGVMASWSP